MPDITDSNKILERLARIEALLETEAQRCPYQVQIARAGNNVQRIEAVKHRHEMLEKKHDALEAAVVENRVSIARIIAISSGVSGVLGAAVLELIQQLSNWIK